MNGAHRFPGCSAEGVRRAGADLVATGPSSCPADLPQALAAGSRPLFGAAVGRPSGKGWRPGAERLSAGEEPVFRACGSAPGPDIVRHPSRPDVASPPMLAKVTFQCGGTPSCGFCVDVVVRGRDAEPSELLEILRELQVAHEATCTHDLAVSPARPTVRRTRQPSVTAPPR